MTFDDFSQSYLGFNDSSLNFEKRVAFEPTEYLAPDSLDWRDYGYVTRVKSQRKCGSCFAFSAIGNIEGQHAKKHNIPAFSLSVQQGFDCDSEGSCLDGGYVYNVYGALSDEGGSMREEDYPYEGVKGLCRTQKDKIAVKVNGGFMILVRNETGLKEAVAKDGPLAVSICVNDHFRHFRGGQVYIPPYPCPKHNHAVLVVGYGNDGQNDYWIIKNSWSLYWAEGGYIFVWCADSALIKSVIMFILLISNR